MTSSTPVRALDADTYDTLELGALAFGGIGAGSDFLWGKTDACALTCNCAHGIVAQFYQKRLFGMAAFGDGNDALGRAGVGRNVNDSAVGRVNKRKGRGSRSSRRITFRAWCKALNVVRGPHPEPTLYVEAV
jgi:hypothetical protein